MKITYPEAFEVLIKPIRSFKRVETDSYSGGCDPDSAKEITIPLDACYPSILEAFHALTGDKSIKADEIRSFDPNTYCDIKGGGVRTVFDGTAKGEFRAMFDRAENNRGRKPSEREMEEFKAEKITLKAATYELYFRVQVAGLDESKLAQFLGISCD